MAPKDTDDVRPAAARLLTAVAIGLAGLLLACCPRALGQTCDTACAPDCRDLVPCGPVLDLRLDVRAEEAIFVDDFIENIAAAQAYGLAAVHFRNAQQARIDVLALLAE